MKVAFDELSRKPDSSLLAWCCASAKHAKVCEVARLMRGDGRLLDDSAKYWKLAGVGAANSHLGEGGGEPEASRCPPGAPHVAGLSPLPGVRGLASHPRQDSGGASQDAISQLLADCWCWRSQEGFDPGGSNPEPQTQTLGPRAEAERMLPLPEPPRSGETPPDACLLNQLVRGRKRKRIPVRIQLN